jgi:hypothetical protein
VKETKSNGENKEDDIDIPAKSGAAKETDQTPTHTTKREKETMTSPKTEESNEPHLATQCESIKILNNQLNQVRSTVLISFMSFYVFLIFCILKS